MLWTDAHAPVIILAREAPACSCSRSPGIWEQCISALRFQKHERHYQIDSLPRAGWVAVPGEHSLVFSDSELIKARGDRKAMLSLHFGEGDQQRDDSCNPTAQDCEECSCLLLRGKQHGAKLASSSWMPAFFFHHPFYWPGLPPPLNLCSKDDTSRFITGLHIEEIWKNENKWFVWFLATEPWPTDSLLSQTWMGADVLNNLLKKSAGRMGFSCLLGTPE